MVMDQVKLTFWEDRGALANIGSSHRNQSRDGSDKALSKGLNFERTSPTLRWPYCCCEKSSTFLPSFRRNPPHRMSNVCEIECAVGL